MRKRNPAFPELEKQILARGILKKDLAAGLGITSQALSRKLVGRCEFTLSEIRYIASIIPDVSVEVLFDINKGK